MPSPLLLKPLSLLAALVVVAAPRPLSDPVGIYALVERVVVAPNAEQPRTIQIWGAFKLAGGSGYTYQAAQRGYLYYTINQTNERATLAEWSDLQKLAGTKQAVGFGARYKALGSVRQSSQAAANPDVYPLGFGMVKLSEAKNADYVSGIVDELRRAATTKSPH